MISFKEFLVEGVTTKELYRNKKHALFHYNDHYHGKDHVSYLVHEYDEKYKGSGGYVQHQHRTLNSALKRVGIKETDLKK